MKGGHPDMVKTVAEHPGRAELLAYGQGRLAAESARALEEHLAACAGCCELLEQAPGDDFLGRLRAAGEPGRDTQTDAAAATGPAAPAVPPELVDHPRYRVLGLLGQGGMGAVYRAEHRRMERPVALKVINPRLMRHPATVERFHQEVRAAARLIHPHIVTAHDADQAGGLHFLVMEYVEGQSLADVVGQRGPLPVGLACDYVRQAALGLQHAHERGMVHRDVKPANLMLAPGGVVKILDFGLARLPHTGDGTPGVVPPAGPLTGAGAVMGTADYIAPEQADDPRTADIRADIYSLGCTLFHLLAARPPFAVGTVAEKLARHRATPLPLLHALRPEVPAGLEAVVARMTAKDPADRYAAPAAVAEALAPFSVAPPPRREGKGGKGRRRLRLLVAAGALVAAGLLAGSAVLGLTSERGADDGEAAQVAAQPTDTGKRHEPQPDGPGPSAVPPEPSEDMALQAVQRLKGKVNRDERDPAWPVTSISLRGTPAADADLAVLAAFPRLTSLDLAGTSVTDTGINYVRQLKQLTTLNLERTAVGDAGLKYLGRLKQLLSLSLWGTRVTDGGMADVGRLTKLCVLDLSETAITDAGLERLTGLGKLTNLGLSSTRGVGDEGMRSLARLKRLSHVHLTGTRVTDRGMRELAGLRQMAALYLDGLKVRDVGVSALAAMARLQVLDLSGTDVTDIGLKEVARHGGLTALFLKGDRKITDAGVKELAGLRRLRYLALDGTAVSDDGVRALAGLPKLEFLVLTDTAVTDAGIQKLASFPALRSVGLRGAGGVTGAGVAELRKARPMLHIRH
jgi:tRNA A-37 threonylcarbamoyl transferase component Bud32